MLPESWKEKKQIFQMRKNASRNLKEKEAKQNKTRKCFKKCKIKGSKKAKNEIML